MLTGPISGGGGAENLITNGTAEAASVSIFTAYADAAGTRPVDGTGGSPNVTTALNSTNPINGTKDFTLIKDAANRQGEGWATTISIPLAYRAKSLKLNIKYLVTSGTFAAGSGSTDGDVIWYFYDVTNSKLVEPSNIKIFSNSTTVSDVYEATVQFDYNTASVRLIAHVSSTSASAYTLQVDDVTLTPQTYVYGTPISDWSAWTPTGSWTTNTTYLGLMRRNCSEMEYQIRVNCSGAPDAASLNINLPSGHVIDTTKLLDTVAGYGQLPGSTAQLGYSSASSGVSLIAKYNNTTSVSIYALVGNNVPVYNANTVTNTSPITIANTDFVTVYLKLPIVGLGSTVQMSESADTRVVSCFKVTGGIPTGTINGGYNAVVWSSVNGDTHNGYNAGTGRYTVKVPGYYRVTATLDINGTFTAGQYIGVRTGNTTTGEYVYNFWKAETSTTSDYPVSTAGTVYAKAGDVLGVDSISSGSTLSFSGSLSGSYFSFDLNQGPSAIALSEKIFAICKTGAGQSLGTGLVIIDYGTIEENSHGLVTTGASWKFTCNRPGLFTVSGTTRISTATRRLDLYKNGAFFRTFCEPSGVDETVGFTSTLRLVAGDYIDVRANNGSTATLYADDRFNYIIIKSDT